jgi:hypothetical protein
MVRGMELVTEQTAAAALLGVTTRTLRDWSTEDGFPTNPGGYDITAINNWREDNQRKGASLAEKVRAIKAGIQSEKLRQMKLDTAKRQLEQDVREEKLLPRESWEQFAALLLSGLADWCEQLPDLIAAEVPKKDQPRIRKRMQNELNSMRSHLADELRRGPSK